MVGNIDRIQAQVDMRSLTLLAGSQNAEANTKIREALIAERGEIVKLTEVEREAPAVQEQLDRSGLDELRTLG